MCVLPVSFNQNYLSSFILNIDLNIIYIECILQCSYLFAWYCKNMELCLIHVPNTLLHSLCTDITTPCPIPNVSLEVIALIVFQYRGRGVGWSRKYLLLGLEIRKLVMINIVYNILQYILSNPTGGSTLIIQKTIAK